LKVPRHCPLVLLVKDLFNFDLKFLREREREESCGRGLLRETTVLERGGEINREREKINFGG
jgi:hypothetical protein